MPLRNLSLPVLVRISRRVAGALSVGYLCLIAVVMTYAAITSHLAQAEKEVRTDVSRLEEQYLAQVAAIQQSDVAAAGYARPTAIMFVQEKSAPVLHY